MTWARGGARMNVPIFLVGVKRNPVHTPKEGNRVDPPNEVGNCALLEWSIISIFITISFPAFLLRLEDIGLEVVGGFTLVDGC